MFHSVILFLAELIKSEIFVPEKLDSSSLAINLPQIDNVELADPFLASNNKASNEKPKDINITQNMMDSSNSDSKARDTLPQQALATSPNISELKIDSKNNLFGFPGAEDKAEPFWTEVIIDDKKTQVLVKLKKVTILEPYTTVTKKEEKKGDVSKSGQTKPTVNIPGNSKEVKKDEVKKENKFEQEKAGLEKAKKEFEKAKREFDLKQIKQKEVEKAKKELEKAKKQMENNSAQSKQVTSGDSKADKSTQSKTSTETKTAFQTNSTTERKEEEAKEKYEKKLSDAKTDEEKEKIKIEEKERKKKAEEKGLKEKEKKKEEEAKEKYEKKLSDAKTDEEKEKIKTEEKERKKKAEEKGLKEKDSGKTINSQKPANKPKSDKAVQTTKDFPFIKIQMPSSEKKDSKGNNKNKETSTKKIDKIDDRNAKEKKNEEKSKKSEKTDDNSKNQKDATSFGDILSVFKNIPNPSSEKANSMYVEAKITFPKEESMKKQVYNLSGYIAPS